MLKTRQKILKKLDHLHQQNQDINHLERLYKVIDHIDAKELRRENKKKGFKYGYNHKYDFVCISHDGTVGEFYLVQGLVIGVPQAPESSYARSKKTSEQYWEKLPSPDDKFLSRIKIAAEYKNYPEMHAKFDPYIDEEYTRRDNGFWFMNDGVSTYITGTHYMYLQWSKIDVGAPDYRDANRVFFYFWEACKADDRCFGMCYLKNRRSGFSFMASSEVVNLATQTRDSRYGILSKTADDAKKMFTGKVVPISISYPFFFKPTQDGMERPKTEISYRVPSRKLTRKTMTEISDSDVNINDGLDTTIDHKATGDNSYDGEKLKLLVHDESGKWEKPNNILNNWRITKTCLRLGAKVIGKCMMGSTSNALDKGGQNFKDLYTDSNLLETIRDGNGQTKSGLYALFIPMQFGYEGFIDRYGFPVFETPEEPVEGVDGNMIRAGVFEYWDNIAASYKNNPNDLNEHFRQFPKTEEHAFRDEATNSLFNLTKIYEQIDHNDNLGLNLGISIGRFSWKDGIKDTQVEWNPDSRGNFRISWMPPTQIQNNVINKNGVLYPGNADLGAFGCDSYDISGTVGGGGSKGALSGMTGFNMFDEVPNNEFFLEYIARPQTAEIFFEDVLMACVFYGMPILIENNKPRLLYHFKNRDYRGFSINNITKRQGQLSQTERELGGIPNSSEDMKQAHSSAIESYINEYVGFTHRGEMGHMPFNRTLNDWAGFEINDRTKYDASISSGLAIMANRRHLYLPQPKQHQKLSVPFSKFNNTGRSSNVI